MAKKLYVSNSTESSRMFKNDFLESLTKIHWSVPLFLDTRYYLFYLQVVCAWWNDGRFHCIVLPIWVGFLDVSRICAPSLDLPFPSYI